MPTPAALQERYWFSRFIFLRLLGLIYFVAFLSLWNQFAPLIGRDGLLPAQPYLDAVRSEAGDDVSAFMTLPTIFWWSCSNEMLALCAQIGVVAALLLVAGFANVPLLLLLWALYLSFVHIGQLFWGYGWEILLLETGFLAIFLVPLIDARPGAASAPPRPVIWMLRWVLFRVMFGAGLIKLRGDACWRDLTCMMFHYETQPLPNPASWYLHHLPAWVHSGEVLFNHFVELIAVWLLVAPRPLRHFGAACIVVFQLALIVSGNLSWLNWLTLALCVPCFDDAALLRFLPRRLQARGLEDDASIPIGRRVVVYALSVVVALLSYAPIANMLGPRQAMNRSFDPLHLVNTYGAFGSVGQVRREVILEGTMDSNPSTAEWREYQFKCKPGDVRRRPCIVAPYHYRLDWQIWFAAMATYRQNPWLIHFASKLLHGDRAAADLLAFDPFPNAPPKFIRAELYEYHFTSRSDATADWWKRQRIGSYLPPLSADDPALQNFLRANNWNN